MKTLEKAEMLERNKVMRVLTEAKILSVVDHPFLASLYGTIVTDTHLHFLMQICEGGELYALLTSQPSKRFKESHVRFYTAEVPPPTITISLLFIDGGPEHIMDVRQRWSVHRVLSLLYAINWAAHAFIKECSKPLVGLN